MDENQGLEWVNFIAKELDREYDRRDILNSRSSTAITSATALVTLSLAVVAVAKGEHFVVTGILKILLLVASLVLLLAAAVLSIFAGASGGRFFVAAAEDMDRMLGQELWGTDTIDARNYTAELDVLAIRSLRSGNNTKYRFLVLGMFTQAFGVLLLGAFAVAVIAS